MRPKVRTQPDVALDSPAHMEAVQDEEHFRRWQRNVADRYKDQSEEEIRADLRATSHPFAVCFENWLGDFNISTGIRNANGFNAREIFYIGDHRWDRRGAVGVHNYTPVQWLSSMDELVALKDRYTLVGIDNVPGSIPMENYQYPYPCLLIFGEESTGLTPATQKMCKDVVHITMYGSVRSFNCGSASGITMYDVVSKFRNNNV